MGRGESGVCPSEAGRDWKVIPKGSVSCRDATAAQDRKGTVRRSEVVRELDDGNNRMCTWPGRWEDEIA